VPSAKAVEAPPVAVEAELLSSALALVALAVPPVALEVLLLVLVAVPPVAAPPVAEPPVPKARELLSSVLVSAFTPGLSLLWVPAAGTRGTFICRMLLPTPGTPSQLRFETGLPVPCGSPHVPSLLKPLAVAATGSINWPADASADVRNIRDLTDILRFLRHLGHEWSCATHHDRCQLGSPHVLPLSRNGTAIL
jgi:hypothetical protein